MADVHSKAIRSYNMSRIKGKDTKPELIVRKFLFSKGFRYKLHDNSLPGKPDIVLPKFKTVIFVNGCFWHGHENCNYFVLPKTRPEWWKNKILATKTRDQEIIKELQAKGWKIITIFECDLKSSKIEKTLLELTNNIH